jgi:ATP-dependent Clp protease adaptor protein ClpS
VTEDSQVFGNYCRKLRSFGLRSFAIARAWAGRAAAGGCEIAGEYGIRLRSGTSRAGLLLWMSGSHFPNVPAVTYDRKTMSRDHREAVASANTPRGADDDRKRRGDPGAPGTAVISKTKPQTKRPSLYRVLILNDDYTPMEFVVHVLERFFNKDHEAATRIMLHVHHHGIGECGVYTYEVAETKVTQVMDFARKHQHPLQCVMEKK